MPPEVSSMKVRIGRLMLVTSLSPTAGMIRPIATRLCSIDMNSRKSSALNAQVSTTCWPVVLMILTTWPRLRRAALPLRAGISIMLSSACGLAGLRANRAWRPSFAAGRDLDRRAIGPTGHQAILETRFLLQRMHQIECGDDQRQHHDHPGHRRGSRSFAALVVGGLGHRNISGPIG